eukprot:TRINITY_DN780245_c0_g1_i1.p1 TRINITY_DN780245_c0_g1~~TRINITY_DN780245_c0_g1_i1.p1  ORF type:complete len:212 (+),score=47.09 TRINITY_DN780245_c0_g1_i1:115-750(+)
MNPYFRDAVPYRNIKPRTREERRNNVSKETLEKARLIQRPGMRGVDIPINVLEQDKESCAFIEEASRFNTDTVGEFKRERDIKTQQSHQRLEYKRQMNAKRDDDRWRHMEAQDEREKQKWAARRGTGEFGRKNNGSVAYDPVTLKYNDGNDGERLAYHDKLVRHRIGTRAQRLQNHMTGDGYNPITGERLREVRVPDAPQALNLPAGTHVY